MTTGQQQSGERDSRASARIALAILLIALLFISGPRSAQTQVISRESEIKAAFIYKFINYVGWPEEAFGDNTSPLVIGVVGSDPVNRYLALIAAQRTAGSRPIKYVNVTDANTMPPCHIIFVGDLAPVELTDAVVAAAKDRPVLLVGESAGFVGDTGGTIEFFIASNKIRIKLSRGAAKSAGLKISSQLAKISKVMP